jgi:hypothetical protein
MYDSANRLADMGDKLREYINLIVTANAKQQEDTAANIINNKESGLAADVKILTEALAQLTKMVTNKENKVIDKENKASNTNTQALWANKQHTGVCNMGAYCHSYGYHPAGKDHNSSTCKYKKDGHNEAATWNNILGENEHWPATTRMAIAQQNHLTYKIKTTPTV